MSVKHLNTADFRELVMDPAAENATFKGERPAIVDFFATWCGPCQAFGPVFEELAKDYEGKVDFYKVDVDENQELSQTLRVRSIPTLIFFPKGSNPKASVGALTKSEMVRIITEDFGVK